MASKERELTPGRITFFSASKENSGRVLVDSGDAYGRMYDQAAVTEDTPEVWIDKRGPTATVLLAKYLDARFKIDRDMQRKLMRYAARWAEDAWNDVVENFFERRGYVMALRGYTYNAPNDLSQDVAYWVYAHKDDDGDTIYSSRDGDLPRYTVLRVHTGCDARWGFGRPMICRSAGDGYMIPVDISASWTVVEGRRANGERMEDRDEMLAMSETWQCGYSAEPTYQLHQDVERVFSYTATTDTICVKLKTGEVVKLQAEAPYAG